MSRRRHRIAWTASLIIHGCLIAVGFFIFHTLQSPGKDDPPVDTRVGAIDDSPICLHVEEPSEPRPPTPLPKAVQQKPTKPIEVTKPKEAIAPQSVTSSQPANPNPPLIPGAGKQQAAPLHGKISSEGYLVVYVLDHSGSMGRAGKLNKAREMLKASMRQLTPGVRFQIVVYDREAEVFRLEKGLEPALATAENIAQAEQQLDQLIAEGSSRHVEGLRIGLRYRPNLLILLSDADDLSAVDVAQVKQWNAKEHTRIHAVILGTPSAEGGSHALKTVCHQGEGIHFLP